MEVSRQAATLWAKKRSGEDQREWLPLMAHLTDTQNVINYLFNHWLSPVQHRQLRGELSEEETQQLVKLVGFVHDIGKATAAFQSKDSYDDDEVLDKALKRRLGRVGFLKFEDVNLASSGESPHALAGEAILKGLKVSESVNAIVGGHHGKPATKSPDEQIDTYTANYYQSDNESEVQKPWRRVQKELFYYGLATSGYQKVSEIPELTKPQAILLEGLLIMADWIASSEYLDGVQNIPVFPLISLDESWDDIDRSRRQFLAMKNWDKSGEWQPQRVDIAGFTDLDKKDPYEKRWGFKARPIQQVMTQEIAKMVDPGMVIIEAPMGLGKTEIALLAAEQLAHITGSDGIFMGLPTQTTTNAMFDRVEQWLKELAETQSENFQVKLMHGRAQFNQKYQDLPQAENTYDDDGHDKPGEVVINEWFSGKKSILTKFTVGTIDNLLLLGLKQKHLFLRHLGFSGKVVVIDEVHAYDAYMNQYLYKAIRWLGAYHVPIIILSATLPKDKRNGLLEAYLKGKYGFKYRTQLNAPENWQNAQDYPLLSLVDGCEIKQINQFLNRNKQKTKVQVQRLNLPDQELVSHVVSQLTDGGIAGIIVNTVKRAQSLAKLVPADVKLMVLHSAFLATERVKQEDQLQSAIGKSGNRPTKMIVIGTQVLEQSLDIDFDILYTDIAPMDLILQRAGRLHRHQISRPQRLKLPQLFIMGIQGPGDYGSGNEAVYGKYLLMKTAHFLKETITLPSEISMLVQQVYDSETDSEVPKIISARDEFANELECKEKKARVFQIGNPSQRMGDTIHDWLGRSQDDVGQNEQKASAAVRDIQETLEVLLVQRTTEGMFLLDNRRLDDVESKEIAQQLIRIPIAITPSPNKIVQAITDLEKLTSRFFLGWQNDIWLKGALALIVDQNLTVDFAGWHLSYSSKLGLEYEKEGDTIV